MSLLNGRWISQEAVDYQIKPDFFVALSACLKKADELSEGEIDNVALRESGIDTVIEKYIGLKASVNINAAQAANAWVHIPDFNKNHPFMQRWQSIASSKDGLKKLKEKDFDFGNVNRKTGKISGVFSTVKIKIEITQGLLKKNAFSHQEIAAIILHEIGHIYSFFETMWMTASTNLAIASAIEEGLGNKGHEIRIKTIRRLKDQGYLEKDLDERKVVQMENDAYSAVLISSSAKEIKTRNECVMYNRTAWEQSADQFAVRMGAGTHLATALNKIAPYSEQVANFWKTTLLVWFSHWITMFLFSIGGILGLYFAVYMSIIFEMVAWSEVAFNTYDRPKDRLNRIRRELIGKLKLIDQKNPLYKATLAELDTLEEEVEKSSNLYQMGTPAYVRAFIYNLFTRELTKKEREQELEQLLNNELYVIAGKMKQL